MKGDLPTLKPEEVDRMRAEYLCGRRRDFFIQVDDCNGVTVRSEGKTWRVLHESEIKIGDSPDLALSDEQAAAFHYRGNSVSYWIVRAEARGTAIDRAWDVLRKAGFHPDGTTELCAAMATALAAHHAGNFVSAAKDAEIARLRRWLSEADKEWYDKLAAADAELASKQQEIAEANAALAWIMRTHVKDGAIMDSQFTQAINRALGK